MRHVNQDNCAAQPDLGAFVVCDGVGGAVGGEVASQLAAQAFLEALRQPRRRRVRRTAIDAGWDAGRDTAAPAAPNSYSEGHPHSRLREAICAANLTVFRQSRRTSGLRGMGTTLVAAFCDPAEKALWLAHVGDSRGYRLRGGELDLLTEDHSLVAEQVRAGTLSRVQAEVSPIRNIITRAIGAEAAVDPEIVAHTMQAGDVYLLATDGLTRELDDSQIAKILTEVLPDGISAAADGGFQSVALETACRALVDAANAQGGRDNITVLLIACT
ncbi:MAG TPA: protein phosphatase 2C domain-containing protein [Acidobacteriaceae bacterium]|nr:protein phosphatase 2C domain-containing protein [Acidobacteriaceae bacterium]